MGREILGRTCCPAALGESVGRSCGEFFLFFCAPLPPSKTPRAPPCHFGKGGGTLKEGGKFIYSFLHELTLFLVAALRREESRSPLEVGTADIDDVLLYSGAF